MAWSKGMGRVAKECAEYAKLEGGQNGMSASTPIRRADLVKDGDLSLSKGIYLR